MDEVLDGSCRPRLRATTNGGAQPFQSHPRQTVAWCKARSSALIERIGRGGAQSGPQSDK